MKILLVNSHHNPNGGTERYYFELSRLLKSKGHKVAFFSMHDKTNQKTSWSKYFVSNVDFNKNSFKIFTKKVSRMFYSIESKQNISRLLDKFKPDIVHINNIYYYISPSILGEIKKRGIPIVQTVHDYQLISPNLIMFYKGKVCEITKKHLYYKAFFDRSIKGSYVASIMAVIVSYLQYFFKFYEKNVSVFITPSAFMKRKLEEYDFKGKSIVHLPNFAINFNNYKTSSKDTKGDYVLYFGRMAEHKGVLTLIRAAKKLPNIKFVFVGGHTDTKVEREIDRLNLVKHKNIKFIDYQDQNLLKETIKNCAFVVVPSIWYENHPYSIMESYGLAKPVVASNIGGIPEIVINNKTGLLFKPNDTNDLSSKIRYLWKNKNLLTQMGRYAKQFVNTNFSQKIYYEKLYHIYKSIKAS